MIYMFAVNNFFKGYTKTISCVYFSKKCFVEKMPEFNSKIKCDIDKFWQTENCNIKSKSNQEKKYVLSMFPYPSGKLHMGHMRVYTVADCISRFNRLLDKNVIFPMGWDSFGLPAENAAIERGLDPKEWTNKNIAEMKEQMHDNMTLSINWDREISTCDKDYFKWTQWIFCRLLEQGMAYQRSDYVNWDPIDQTVLADELIDNQGRSWRSGVEVEKKILRQWWIRTTAFSKQLLEGLDYLEQQGEHWRHVIQAQRGWIGQMEGVYVDLDLVNLPVAANPYQKVDPSKEKLGIFTNAPSAFLAGFAEFVQINPDNIWWLQRGKKNLVELSACVHPYLAVRHPISKNILPIVINPHLKFNYQQCITSLIGMPAINIEDAKLAAKVGLNQYTNGLGRSVKLGMYNHIKESCWPIVIGDAWDNEFEQRYASQAEQWLQSNNRAGYQCSSMRKDWLISRQRKWGTPIPVVYCHGKCAGTVIVPDEKLPWQPPTQSNEPIECPKCGEMTAIPDTDTMDTFVDSSWYYLRYLDATNPHELCSAHNVQKFMPVDIYIGGIEHAIRHLFYSRFISHFLHCHTHLQLPKALPEPFTQFLPIGLVMSQTFVNNKGKYIPANQISFQNNQPIVKTTGEQMTITWDKMSKSKHNGIDPGDVVGRYGIDTTRLVLLSNTGPDKQRKWEENDVVVGVQKWERKIWKLIKDCVEVTLKEQITLEDYENDLLLNNEKFISKYKKSLDKIMVNYDTTYTFSVIIAVLQSLIGDIRKLEAQESLNTNSLLYNRILLDYLVLLYPLSPLFSSELWAQLSDKLIKLQPVFQHYSDKYYDICGPWNYDLDQPIWNQNINGLFKIKSKAERKSRISL